MLYSARLQPYFAKRQPAIGGHEPKNWFDVLAMVSASLTESEPEIFRVTDLIRPRLPMLAIHPDMSAVALAARGGRFAYLCWGLPAENGNRWLYRMKLTRLAFLLRRAAVVFVNDQVTARQLRHAFGVQTEQVPFPVDTNYFCPQVDRDDYWLIPGDNDRDEQLAQALARAGRRIIRVCRVPAVAALHAASPEPNLSVRVSVPFPELRNLYQRAAAVLLPLVSSNHAAGQTAALEAMAAGAPLVVSRGRTSTIVGSHAGVRTCSGQDPEAWQAAVMATIDTYPPCGDGPDPRVAAHEPGLVAEQITAILRERL